MDGCFAPLMKMNSWFGRHLRDVLPDASGERETVELNVVETKKPKSVVSAAWALRKSWCFIV